MKHRYMNDEPGDTGGAAAVASTAETASTTSSTTETASPEKTVLESASTPVETVSTTTTPEKKTAADVIPAKFQVKDAEGKIDLDASVAKMEESRSKLEKDFTSQVKPPKTAEEYTINVPEQYKETVKSEVLLADPMFKDFASKAHAAGFTQAQMDLAVTSMLERTVTNEIVKADACEESLRKDWSSDAEFKRNVGNAHKFLGEAAGDKAGDMLKKYGNDADFIRMAARIGAQMGGDSSAPSGASGLMSKESMTMERERLAKWTNDPTNQTKPEYQQELKKYQDLGVRLYGNGPRKSGSINVMSV